MKLRNKKTGEIVEREELILIKHIKGDGGWQDGSYHSLAELNEEWEDVRPTKPLIKEEKLRKLIQAWAEEFSVTKVYVCGIGTEYIELYAQDNGVTDGRIRISLKNQDGIQIGEEYTTEELCGEEDK